jgi:hypothetical protein
MDDKSDWTATSVAPTRASRAMWMAAVQRMRAMAAQQGNLSRHHSSR